MTTKSISPPASQPALERAPSWVRLAASVIRRLPFARSRLAAKLQNATRPFLGSYTVGNQTLHFICDLRDSISREVYFTGHYERLESTVLESILRPGMVFCDVGANWGYFTLAAAALVGNTGKLLSFEPDPRLFPMLSQNVELNHLVCAKPLQLAAGSGDGTALLQGFDELAGNWGVSKLVAADKASQGEFEVRVAALDDVLAQQQVEHVDLAKIDIEGAEIECLKGMRRGLAAGRYKRILLELHPALLADRGQSMDEAIAILREHGYEGCALDHSLAAVRRASYASRVRLEEYVQPLGGDASQADWPHTLWIAPGASWPEGIVRP